jgi:hypothetical protein
VLAARPQNTAKQTHELTIPLVMEGVTNFLIYAFQLPSRPRAALIRIQLSQCILHESPVVPKKEKNI